MHIVFVSAFFANNKYDSLSGMPQYVYKIANYLQKLGHSVEIVAGSTNGNKWKYKNIMVYNAQWFGDLATGTKFEISLSIVRREIAIQKILHLIDKSSPIDIVQYAGWSGTGCLHSLKCPMVLRLSTYSKVQYANNEIFKDYIDVYSIWERMAGRRADGIISPGELLGKQFGKDISRKVTIMETPYSNNIKEDMRCYNENLKDIKYMLYYGSSSKDKGFETIAEMLPHFFEINNDMQFVFAGWDTKTKHGSAIQNMRSRIGKYADRMIYLGALQHEQLYPIIRKAEFVLIPSLIDNLPNSCLEALSLNKIVIGTYHTSLEQMISDGANGFLSEPGNADSLLDAVMKACSLTVEQRNNMLLKNKEMVKKYSPEVAVDKLEHYYYWLLHKKIKGGKR
jgi:glycosyltransferase involved in cell wall biosynthesis